MLIEMIRLLLVTTVAIGLMRFPFAKAILCLLQLEIATDDNESTKRRRDRSRLVLLAFVILEMLILFLMTKHHFYDGPIAAPGSGRAYAVYFINSVVVYIILLIPLLGAGIMQFYNDAIESREKMAAIRRELGLASRLDLVDSDEWDSSLATAGVSRRIQDISRDLDRKITRWLHLACWTVILILFELFLGRRTLTGSGQALMFIVLALVALCCFMGIAMFYVYESLCQAVGDAVASSGGRLRLDLPSTFAFARTVVMNSVSGLILIGISIPVVWEVVKRIALNLAQS